MKAERLVHPGNSQPSAPSALQSGRPAAAPLDAAHAEAGRCIQCGFCLPACPTYQVFGVEKHSPRGRIQLAKAWAEGKAEPDAALLAALDLCLDCRACETACPIDVRYGVIIAGARDELAERRASGRIGGVPSRLRSFLMKLVLRHVVAKPRRLRRAAAVAARVVHGAVGRRLAALAGRRPGSWLEAALTFARALPRPTRPASSAGRSAAGGSPLAGFASEGSPWAGPAAGESRSAGAPGRAALFLGCAQEGLFPETNRAAEALLRRAGFAVEIPAGQGCCGALHRHNGDKEYARRLVLHNLRVFGAFDEEPAFDVIATTAGGCLAWIKEAAELFPPGSREHQAARRFAERARDISEILVEAGAGMGPAAAPGSGNGGPSGRAAPAAVPGSSGPEPRVVYQPSCHLTNVCGVGRPPLELLRRLHGGSVSLPADGGSCCGSAGIYNALHPQASRAVLECKMDAVAAARPDVIVTSNPGCHLQMLAGVQARGLDGRVRVVQLADWLYEQTVPGRREPLQNGTFADET